MMPLTIENTDHQDEWIVRCAPQCLTDILVQVTHAETPEQCVFTFCLGKMLREMVEDYGTWDGTLVMDKHHVAVFERWASQLDLYAEIIRSALKYAVEPAEADQVKRV